MDEPIVQEEEKPTESPLLIPSNLPANLPTALDYSNILPEEDNDDMEQDNEEYEDEDDFDDFYDSDHEQQDDYIIDQSNRLSFPHPIPVPRVCHSCIYHNNKLYM